MYFSSGLCAGAMKRRLTNGETSTGDDRRRIRTSMWRFPSGQNTRTPSGSEVYTFPGSTPTSKVGKPHEYFDLTGLILATAAVVTCVLMQTVMPEENNVGNAALPIHDPQLLTVSRPTDR